MFHPIAGLSSHAIRRVAAAKNALGPPSSFEIATSSKESGNDALPPRELDPDRDPLAQTTPGHSPESRQTAGLGRAPARGVGNSVNPCEN